MFGCYHCLVMLSPAGKGGNPRISPFPSIVFLAFLQLYFSAAQTSISRFCSIVFLCGANKYFSVFLHCICVCTSPASFHRELWDFKSVERCLWYCTNGNLQLHVSTFLTEITFACTAKRCLLVALNDLKSAKRTQINQRPRTLKS